MKPIFSIPLFLFLACGVEKELAEDRRNDDHEVKTETEISLQPEEYNVQLQLYNFTPYCGGAAPDWEDEMRQTSPMSNTTFIFIDYNTDTKREVKSDNNGVLRMYLQPGKYALREKYKDVSYEEFYKQYYHAPDDYYFNNGDTSCYYNWWTSNLVGMVITNPDSLYDYQVTTYAQCFTGINPCISYMGAYPP